MIAVAENLLTAAKYTGKLAADCAKYLGRTSLDLVDGGLKLWLRRERGKTSERAAEIDSKLESIRAGQQTRWSDFRSLPAARKRLIQIASWSAALLAAYASVPPSGPPGPPDSAGSGRAGSGRKRVNVWEGDIHAEKRYQGADGRVSWTANYHVRLQEDCFAADSIVCGLEPLELEYSIEANEVLDKYHYGVYASETASPSPHDRSVIGKASGILRLRENEPDASKFWSNLHGEIYKDKQTPSSPLTDLPHDSNAQQHRERFERITRLWHEQQPGERDGRDPAERIDPSRSPRRRNS